MIKDLLELSYLLYCKSQLKDISEYDMLMLRDIPNINKDLWKLKTPLKIKIFLWYLRKGVILTKDNLAKCSWQGSLTCAFCHKEETINHLLFECRLALSVWSVLQMATSINQPYCRGP
jgi:hypothetical protein